MVLPILAGLGGAVASLSSFTNNKLVAWMLVVVFLLADSGTAVLVNYTGIAGGLFGFVLSALLGITIVAYSWQVLILIVFFSVIGLMFSMDKS